MDLLFCTSNWNAEVNQETMDRCSSCGTHLIYLTALKHLFGVWRRENERQKTEACSICAFSECISVQTNLNSPACLSSTESSVQQRLKPSFSSTPLTHVLRRYSYGFINSSPPNLHQLPNLIAPPAGPRLLSIAYLLSATIISAFCFHALNGS